MAKFVKQEKTGAAKKFLPVAAILAAIAALGTAVVLSREPADTPSVIRPSQLQTGPAHTTPPASASGQETEPEQSQTEPIQTEPENHTGEESGQEILPDESLPAL